MAIFKLAKVYEKLNEEEEAKSAFLSYVHSSTDGTRDDRDEVAQACLFLARYYVKHNLQEEAYEYAHKCTEFPDTKEEAKGLLKQLADTRVLPEGSSLMHVEMQDDVGHAGGLTSLEEQFEL